MLDVAANNLLPQFLILKVMVATIINTLGIALTLVFGVLLCRVAYDTVKHPEYFL